MAKSTKTNQSGAAAVMQEIAENTVQQIILIVNPAPLIPEENLEEGDTHRGNTPWYIEIPALGIAVQVRDKQGEPKTGYYPDDRAKQDAMALWEKCRSNPELLAELQQNREWPETLLVGFKSMFRSIEVQPIEG